MESLEAKIPPPLVAALGVSGPSLRASGFRYRPRLDLRHPGLRSAGRLAGWVLLFVVTNQVSLTVVTRL